MDYALRYPLHPVNDTFPVLCQFLHAKVVEIHTVTVIFVVGLSVLRRQIIVRTDNHIVIVNKICSETIRKCFSERIVEL